MSEVMLQAYVAVQAWAAQAKGALVRDEEGQGLIEYSLILGLVAVLAIAVLLTMGGQVNNILSNITRQLDQSPAA